MNTIETQAVTLTRTAPGVIADDTTTGTAILIEPGTYMIESVDRAEHFAYINVPSVDGWYVAIHTDWLGDQATLPARPKGD